MMRTKSQWVILLDCPAGMVIKDIGDTCMSVTNDAEAVVSALAKQLGDRRLFYFDSENRLDELRVENGAFAGFRHGASGDIRDELRREGLLSWRLR